MIAVDHEFVRRGLEAMIGAEPDMIVCGALAGAEDGYRLVVEHRPDVVLLDASARSRGAIGRIEAIRHADVRVRIVALSLYDKPDYIRQLLSAGVSAFVLKLDVAERLLAVVRTAAVRKPDEECVAVGEHGSVRQRSARRIFDDTERNIVDLIGRGCPTATIAVRLRLPLEVVQTCRRRIQAKLKMPSARRLVEFCVDWRLRQRSLPVAG